MPQSQYSKAFLIQHTDADLCRRIKPSALLRYTEQVSVEHAAANGMDDAFFASRSLAMLLGRQALRFARVPLCGETLTLTTQAEAFRHGSFKRITRVYDDAGREIALVDARWILVDTEKGHILRAPAGEAPGYWVDTLPGELPQQVHKSEDEALEPAGERRAFYSLCDANGHINNACYLDIACDALPPQILQTAPVIFAAVKYSREVPLGQKMEVLRARSAAGWYVTGRREGKNAFECYLELAR